MQNQWDPESSLTSQSILCIFTEQIEDVCVIPTYSRKMIYLFDDTGVHVVSQLLADSYKQLLRMDAQTP